MTLLLYTAPHASAPESSISISGIVTDGSNPIEKAVVSLVKDPLFVDTTDTKGVFLRDRHH
jgi:hypothetical protein